MNHYFFINNVNTTHLYDTIYKCCLAGAFIYCAYLINDLLNWLNFKDTWFGTFIAFLIFLGSLVGFYYFFKHSIFPSWIPAYIYVRDHLKTKINITEAKQLNFLFDGSLCGRWYSGKSLKYHPKEQRKEILFQVARKIMENPALIEQLE